MNCHILVLYEISRRMKSRDDLISISSSELGISLGISQQTASRHLLNLEERNLIGRKVSNDGQEIRLTSDGFDVLHGIYTNLKEFFEDKGDIKENPAFEGNAIVGIGEGAYYIREYEDRIKEILGFKPFPGTLNIKLKEPRNLRGYSKGIIKGFKNLGRTFGDVKFMPVKITMGEKSADCYLIIPKRTHYKDVVEIMAGSNLRKMLGIKNLDCVRIELIK